MNTLGPEDDVLERREVARSIAVARAASPQAATDLAAAPLWTTFRDYYTRAKARTRLNAEGEFACDELSQD